MKVKLKHSRHLDLLVAENVMDWTVRVRLESFNKKYEYAHTSINSGNTIWLELPNFSSNMTDSMKVVDKIDKDYDVVVERRNHSKKTSWIVEVFNSDDSFQAEEETPEKAICVASLLMVGIEVIDDKR